MANPSKTRPRFERCIVLGMDGLDPRLVAELMRDNKLHNFARLANGGTFAPLQTSNPVMSPVSWSNIATGAGPGRHGIFDFLRRDPRNYMPSISLRKSSTGLLGTKYEKARQADGFWRYTSNAGIPTTVLRWPVTFPPEKVNGRFLSGLGVPDLLGTEGQYAFYTTEPMPQDDPSPHNVIQVHWQSDEGDTIRTSLKGPTIGRGRTAEISLTIRRRNPGTCLLQIGGNALVEANRNEWTPWVKVVFRAGLSRISGMVRFILLEAASQLKLLVCPIHLDPANPAFDISCPAEYARSLGEKIGAFHTLGMPELVHPLSHHRYGFDEFLAQVQPIRAERKQMLLTELEQFHKGLFACVFDHTDRIQHAFWATRDPAHPTYDERESRSYGHVIEDMYREMDACLGQAMARCNRETLLLAVSDHGFGSFRRQVHLNRWLIDSGYMRLTERQDAEGRGLFLDVDWRNTRAYAVGFSSIYLNLTGREGEGSVRPGESAHALRDELASRLRTLVDPAGGGPVVHQVYPGSRIYAEGPVADDAPDLVVGFKPGYRASWQTALGGAPLPLVEDNLSRWSGDHIFDPGFVPGIILSNAGLQGPLYRGIDIAPTILTALGVETPASMTGRNLLRADTGS
jgi:predicted AlkP superfamily phosphohydrolase/phosphomutase